MYIEWSHADSREGFEPGTDDFKAGRAKGREDKAAHPEWTPEQIREAASDYSSLWLMQDKRALKRMNGYLAAFGMK
jgi:hypothetical protein